MILERKKGDKIKTMKDTDEITNSEDIIDSRDVIARIEYLEGFLIDPEDIKGGEGFDYPKLEDTGEMFELEFAEVEELKALRSLAEDGSCSPDWEYGEALIRYSYFTDYAQELAEDCCDTPKDLRWPYTCIDWDQAARELQSDYFTVDFDDVTYWIRA